MNCLLKDVQR